MLALQQLQPMDDAISSVEAPRRFNTDLITAFAVGALLLAITGIYAVVAFSVSLRTQELAIRIALGAQRIGIARLVLVSAAKLTLLGCGLGVLGFADRITSGQFVSLRGERDRSFHLFGGRSGDDDCGAGCVRASCGARRSRRPDAGLALNLGCIHGCSDLLRDV